MRVKDFMRVWRRSDENIRKTTSRAMNRMRRGSLVAVIIAGLTAGGAGVAWSASTPTPAQVVASAEIAPTKILQTVPLKTKPPQGKTIVYIDPPFPNTELIGKELAVTANAVGWHYDTIAWDGLTAASADSALTTALLKKPTAVVIQDWEIANIPASIKSAYKKAGVPIILSSADPFTRTSTFIADVAGPSIYTKFGTLMADWFVTNSGGTGNALIPNLPAYVIYAPLVSAFETQVNNICQACSVKVIDVSAADLGAGKYNSDIVNALLADKSLNYVFALSSDFIIGIQSALATAGLSDVKIAGVVQDSDSIAALQAGTESAWVTYDADYTAFAFMDVALRWYEKMSPSTWTVDTYLPVQILTPSNVGDITTWNEPGNALQQFEKLWKVKVTK